MDRITFKWLKEKKIRLAFTVCQHKYVYHKVYNLLFSHNQLANTVHDPTPICTYLYILYDMNNSCIIKSICVNVAFALKKLQN